LPVTVTITRQPTGAVVATGCDEFAHSLLSHVGFTRHSDWHGRRFRLPTTMAREVQNEIVDDAFGLLTMARYEVDLAGGLVGLAGGRTPLNRAMLALADRVRLAETGGQLAAALAPLVHTQRGVLVRLQEALEAASEQVADLNPEKIELQDRLGAASEQLFALNDELTGVIPEASGIEGTPIPQWSRTASPAADRSGVRAAAVPETDAPVPAGPARGGRAR
jgi:hypothetical protein